MRTLADCFALLNPRDKATLALILRLNTEPKLDVEVATLAFVKVDVTLKALDKAIGSSTSFKRYYSQLKEKVMIALRVETPGVTVNLRYLDNAKVAKRIGPYPERGFLLKGHALKRTAGLKPGPFGRGIERVEVAVSPLVTLHNNGGSQWLMTVHERYLQTADDYLAEHLDVKQEEINGKAD